MNPYPAEPVRVGARTLRPVDPNLKAALRKAVSDAYYEARDAGRTMEQAADDAVEALLPILQAVDENAHARGKAEAGGS